MNKTVRMSLFSLLFILLFSINVNAYSSKDEDMRDYEDETKFLETYGQWRTNEHYGYYVLDGKEVFIRGYSGNEEIVRIPETIDGAKVVKLQNYSFRGYNDNLKKIIIPKTVYAIGAGTFDGCDKLEEVVIEGDGLYSIGSSAFSGCKSLQNIQIPDSVGEIGKYAFDDCKSLTSITLPGSLEKIFNGCFSGSGIVSIDMPGKIWQIGEDAFRNCKNLEKVNMSKTMANIGDYAFVGCPKLKMLEIPRKVSEIGNCIVDSNTILQCHSLSGGLESWIEYKFVVDNDKIIYTGDYNSKQLYVTGYLDKNVKKVKIKEYIKLNRKKYYIYEIQKKAFKNFKNLQVVKCEKINNIEKQAFYGCKKLKKIFVNKDVSFEKKAFGNTYKKLIVNVKKTKSENCLSLKKKIIKAGAKKTVKIKSGKSFY